MIRFLAIFAFLLPFVATAASAQTRDPRTTEDGSVERSARAFHAFVDCLGRRYDAASDRVISSSDWHGEFQNLRRLARDADCTRHSNIVSLEADPLLIRGVLAESRFEEIMDQAGEQPRFLGLPSLISEADLAGIATGDMNRRRSALMFIFADCVARNATSGVVALLSTASLSKEEGAAFAELGGTLGACMPASEGTQLQFSAPALRSYLALASYYLQRIAAGDEANIMASFPASEEAAEAIQEDPQ